MKIRPAEPDCSLQADMTNLIVTFRNSENLPNKGKIVYWVKRLLIHPSLYRHTLKFAISICVSLALINNSVHNARVHKYWASG
jgi:hypothetical protein